MAISAAFVVLGFLEMPEDDSPPEEIWHHGARLEEWFEAVKQRREAGVRGQEPIEDAPMVTNELTAQLLGEK